MPLTDEEKRKNKVERTYERFKALTFQKCKNETLKHFQAWRRYSSFGDEWWLPSNQVECISCGVLIADPRECDAGHYVSRKILQCAFLPSNCHPQCKHCNQYLHGNQASYRIGLLNRIGLQEVLLIEATRDGVTVEMTKFALAEMLECYRGLAKAQKERLGL